MAGKKRKSVTSTDADDAEGASQRSQLRKRYDLSNARATTPPPSINSRPTIPTPRPRLALSAVPRRLVDDTGMRALPLDHRAAFLMMHIDGKTPLRTLVDVTGMIPEEVVTLVERLLELNAIAIL